METYKTLCKWHIILRVRGAVQWAPLSDRGHNSLLLLWQKNNDCQIIIYQKKGNESHAFISLWAGAKDINYIFVKTKSFKFIILSTEVARGSDGGVYGWVFFFLSSSLWRWTRNVMSPERRGPKMDVLAVLVLNCKYVFAPSREEGGSHLRITSREAKDSLLRSVGLCQPRQMEHWGSSGPKTVHEGRWVGVEGGQWMMRVAAKRQQVSRFYDFSPRKCFKRAVT